MAEDNAAVLRAKAAHARRLAQGTHDRLAVERLNAFADKCERDADALEAQAPPPRSPPAQHVAQQQQQPQADKADEDKKV
jgi:hypothetical protein